MNIVFYNHFNNGDIHVSREFVRQILAKAPKPVGTYAHKNDPRLISDIPDLHHNRSFLSTIGTEHRSIVIGDTLFINTWYAAAKYRYMNRFGISFDCLYFLFDDICKEHFKFSLDDISSDPTIFFPKINYKEYHIENIQPWLDSTQGRKKVFIANGFALSGQADNFGMGHMVKTLAQRYPDVIFILTNKENFNPYDNIAYSSNIIQKPDGSDLNENGYLSTHCDLIIGRASGAYTFAFNHDNLFKRNPKFLCFSNLTPQRENKFWLGDFFRDKINYTSETIVSNESNELIALELIEKYL